MNQIKTHTRQPLALITYYKKDIYKLKNTKKLSKFNAVLLEFTYPIASLSDSSCITFSSMRSNAATELELSMLPTISCICRLVLALAARAFRVSFLFLASANLFSSVRVLAMICSVAYLDWLKFPLKLSAVACGNINYYCMWKI